MTYSRPHPAIVAGTVIAAVITRKSRPGVGVIAGGPRDARQDILIRVIHELRTLAAIENSPVPDVTVAGPDPKEQEAVLESLRGLPGGRVVVFTGPVWGRPGWVDELDGVQVVCMAEVVPGWAAWAYDVGRGEFLS